MKIFDLILSKFSAGLMLMAIAGTTFSKAIALLDYKLNEKYISSTLCENKNKPACCCHGKCFLKKQLQKDEGGNKNNFPFSKDRSDVSFFCGDNGRVCLNAFARVAVFHDHYLVKKYTALLSPVFHPPGA